MSNLARGFLAQQAVAPQRPAVELGASSVSYAGLAGLARRWRVSLAAMHSAGREKPPGVQPAGGKAAASSSLPDCVAWSGQNHLQLPALYLACVQAGYCLALLDPQWPAATRTAALQQIRPFCVIDPGSLPASAPPGSESQPGLPDASADAFFLLGFTSGSTGVPKAFVRRQISWMRSFEHAAVEFPGNRHVLAPGPLSHGLSFYAMAETLHRGGTFYGLQQFDAAAALHLLQNRPIDTLVVVPTMLVAILQAASGLELQGTLRQIISAGSKLSAELRGELLARWPGVRLSEYYGASELSFVTVAHCAEHLPADSVGRAFDGVTLSIRDAGGQDLAAGRKGEVFVHSDMLADGYLSADGLQRLRVQGRFASVGDIGRLDAAGNLYLLDRRDNMIICGGLNVYPAEVQSVLDSHPAIAQSIVTAVPDPYWGQKVCALLRLEAQHSLSIGNFNQFCREHLAPQQIPRKVMTIERWPLTSSGKIATAELAALLTSGAAQARACGLNPLSDD